MSVEVKEIQKRIGVLKKEKKAVILAHNYQVLEVQKVADMVGDSYQLSKAASEVKSDILLFCGVRFMGETAKLLNPVTKVLLSDGEAGCPMADMAPAYEVKEFKKANPDHLIVCYVNSTAETKALSDVCVTSSNAVRIVDSLPKDKPIMFLPDKNLGHYINQITGRKMDLWEGMCPIHHININMQDIHKARLMYPKHSIIVHPECPPAIVSEADFVGSTKELFEYAKQNDKLIIGTEVGLIRMIQSKYPRKSIHALSERAICPNMKRTSINFVLETLRYELNEIKIPPKIAERALIPIQKMMELNK